MKILIFEDEIPAYEKLRAHIENTLPNAEYLGWARSIHEAKLLLNKHQQIDLIFSDIELLDGKSLSVFEEIKVNCPIIFCTAFDQYLLQAFKTNGIAYLLKPYDKTSFDEALGKYKSLFKTSKKKLDPGLISELKLILESERESYKTRFSIKKKGGIKLLSVNDIICIQANGDFCFANDVKREKHIINSSLSLVENKLNPKQFFRINRSEIINIDCIEKIEASFKNKLAIKMKAFDETLYTSSSKTKSFRAWLDKS